MPFYSCYTPSGRLINKLKRVLDKRGKSSFKLSKEAQVSPTTTRKIYNDENYIPSPSVLEQLCIALDVQPGEILELSPRLDLEVCTASGVFSG